MIDPDPRSLVKDVRTLSDQSEFVEIVQCSRAAQICSSSVMSSLRMTHVVETHVNVRDKRLRLLSTDDRRLFGLPTAWVDTFFSCGQLSSNTVLGCETL